MHVILNLKNKLKKLKHSEKLTNAVSLYQRLSCIQFLYLKIQLRGYILKRGICQHSAWNINSISFLWFFLWFWEMDQIHCTEYFPICSSHTAPTSFVSCAYWTCGSTCFRSTASRICLLISKINRSSEHCSWMLSRLTFLLDG